jgi:hypothetical protein
MSEEAVVILAVAAGVVLTLLVLLVASLLRTIRELRTTVAELRAESAAAMDELHQTVRTANAELERVDDLLASAQAVTGTVDSASRLAFLALGNPVVKSLAFASGANRAWRRFRTERMA